MKHCIFLLIIWLITPCACETSKESKDNTHAKDTLKISYLDTVLTGERIFPMSQDTSKLRQLIDSDVLLTFKSGDYYYVFFNGNKSKFISNSYWDKLALDYLSYFESDSISKSQLTRIDYPDGPFLSGIYSENDSIITYTADLRKGDQQSFNKLRVRYFSTRDTLIAINDKVKVGSRLENVLSILKIPFNNNNP